MPWVSIVGSLALIAIIACVLMMTTADDNRWVLASLGMMYLGASWFVVDALPFTSVLAKVTTGVGVCLILGLSLRAADWQKGGLGLRPLPSSRYFRLFGAMLVIIAALGLRRSDFIMLLDLPEGAGLVSVMLVAAGLMQVGLFISAFRVGVGLLVLLAGFEVLYSYVEPSLAVMALIASVNMGAAMVISYLIYREKWSSNEAVV